MLYDALRLAGDSATLADAIVDHLPHDTLLALTDRLMARV